MAKQIEKSDLALNKLKADLKTGSFARIYIFYGEERYLLEYYLAALKKAILGGSMEEFNYHRLTSENASFEALRDAVEAPPMMAERTMVQAEDYDLFAQNEETRTALTELLSDIPETCTLVLVYDTVAYKRNAKYRKLADAIRENACEVEFFTRSGRELSDWIARHFRGHGKTISPDLCQYLVFRTGGSMTALAAEIEKIAAYSAAEAIVRADIDAVTEPVLSAAIFDVTDALSDRNYALAIGKLCELLQMEEEPISLLAALGAHFRRLYGAKVALSAGKGADAVMALVGTNSDYYARKLMAQAGRLTEDFCRHALEACYQADCSLKRSAADGADVLELMLLELAQEVRK